MTEAKSTTKTRKPNVGSDPAKGSRVKRWQLGLYAFAIGASLVLILANLMLIINGTFSAVFLIIALLITGLSWGLVVASDHDAVDTPGERVTAEPALTDFVAAVAAAVDAPVPDAVHLATEAELGVIEHTQFFGLKVDSSALVIGLPFVHALTKRELAALLAHELAHYTDGDVAHGPRAIRGLQAARDLIAIERKGFVNGVYGSYARKMFRSVGGVGVAQEEAADRLAAEAFGTAALRSALARYDDIAVAHDQLLRDYVVPALQEGVHPADMFSGFTNILESPPRITTRATQLKRRQDHDRTEFELHRSPVERLAAVNEASAAEGSATLDGGDEPAHTLLDPEAKSVDIVVGRWASKLMGEATAPRTWDQLVDEVYAHRSSEIAMLAFDDDVDFEQVLTWSQDQDWDHVDLAVQKRLKSSGDAQARRREWLVCVITHTASEAGHFSWQHNWHGPASLVDSNGAAFDADPIAALLLAGEPDEAKQALRTATT